MTSREWHKDRNQTEWDTTKQEVCKRDEYTCVYCQITARKFMQVNHIGAEDDHSLENLETILGQDMVDIYWHSSLAVVSPCQDKLTLCKEKEKTVRILL
jgi:hypothetical protein